MALSPRPVQRRAVPTVQAAIDATIELIDQVGEDEVRLADVTLRSGVSNGSLMHHFGSRDGLVAAALATRFDRVVVERIASFALVADAGRDPSEMLLGSLSATSSPERSAARRARVRALSYARHRPDLRASLASSIRSVEAAFARSMASSTSREVVASGVSSTELAVFAETASLGLLLEDRLTVPLPREEWASLHLMILEAVLVPEVHARVRAAVAATAELAPVRLEVAPPTVASAATERPAMPTLDLTVEEREVVLHVVRTLRDEGSDAVTVGRACAETGMSRGQFSRRIGTREDLIDLARVAGMLARARTEVATYEQAFGGAADADSLVDALRELATRSTSDRFRSGAWDRLEVLVAADTHGTFARDAGAVTTWALERIGMAVHAAQVRGLVRHDVSPRALARFLWSYPLAYLVGEVAGVADEELLNLAVRTAGTFVADQSGRDRVTSRIRFSM